MKKIISLSLVFIMLCSLFVGCGSKGGDSEEVVLTVAIPWAKQKDTDQAVDEVNKKLETLLPNTKIELLLDSEMADKWSLWMSTQKSIDIAHSGFCTVLEDEVLKETYLELDELVEEYAPNIKELREKYWNAYDNATIQGKLYAIPNVQRYTKDTTMIEIWYEAAEHIDMKALRNEAISSDKTTEKFYQIFTEGLDKAAAAGVDCSNCINLTLYEIAQRGYHFIGGNGSNLCYDNSDSGKILDFYTTQEFATFCKYMKIWADKGWVSNDILTGQWSDKTYARTSYRYGSNEDGIREVNAHETNLQMCLDTAEQTVLTTDIGDQGTYWSIPYTSEHPERAMQFLNLLHSEEGTEIVNLLAFGIEGTHYEFTDKEESEIQAFDYQGQGSATSNYGIPCWMVSNMMLGMYNVAPYTSEQTKFAEDYYEGLNNAKKHILYGCSFDTSGIRNELSNIIKNNNEYSESVYCGIVANSDQILKELLDKNKVAGQEKVMEELQKQADEYIASQK